MPAVMRRLMAGERGFTIVEMLSAMAVFAIVLGIFSVVMSSSIRHSGEVEQQTNLQVEARAAITAIAQDLRQVYDGDDNVATSPIESMFGNNITVLSPDRQYPFHLRRVRYRYTAGKLERAFSTSTDTDGWPWSGLTSPTNFRPLVTGVVNDGTQPVFAYRDANGDPTANPLLVRTIDVTVVVATKTSPTRKYTYQSSVTVRGEA